MLSKATIKKLQQIERHQLAAKRLVAEVQDQYGLADVEDAQGWTWDMNIDQQGRVWPAASSARLLEEMLARKHN